MNNSITASIIFSFKGQTHSPSLEINLDDFMQKSGKMPNVCMLLAKAGNYDLYSYEYEMMQAEPISYSNPHGIVADFVNNGVLDIAAFEAEWVDIKVLDKLQSLVKKYLPAEDLQQNTELKNVLLEAYKLGKKS